MPPAVLEERASDSSALDPAILLLLRSGIHKKPPINPFAVVAQTFDHAMALQHGERLLCVSVRQVADAARA